MSTLPASNDGVNDSGDAPATYSGGAVAPFDRYGDARHAQGYARGYLACAENTLDILRLHAPSIPTHELVALCAAILKDAHVAATTAVLL